ncbi:putative helicase DEXDc superfamily protein [Proteus phage 2207-N35]|nr:putative helicase DEXDc superfamily protein [Proteus phage 2207-N35]
MQPLRPHQVDAVEKVTECWNSGDKDVCLVLPTGAGKTRVMAEFARLETGITLIVAHRKELVSQIALAVATQKVKHRFIAQKSAIKFSTSQQMKKLGHSYFVPAANVIIASAQTLVNAKYERWHDEVSLYMTDEGHHLIKGSTWGKCREKFKNARGLCVTATPIRADGKGLGRHASGYVDSMIVGPSMRELIKLNYLADYDLVIEETDLDLAMVEISKTTGDYSKPQLNKAVSESRIVGDSVETWLKYAKDRLTVVFAVSVESSEELAEEFRQHGIKAEAISAKNSDEERASILDRFEKRKTLVLVNCDLFGEGFDAPAIECCMMDRPTESYSLFCQQFGRALRYVPGKRALIIDKVGNIRRFMARGFPLPDNHYHWSLDDAEKNPQESLKILNQ